jgi:dTDP-4-amino-4,6-dideoxygalactose transaminase
VIVGVHVSGVPCDVLGLEKRAAALGARLVFDAAHGAGSITSVDGAPRPLGGFGSAEVFSLTPTKVLSGAEGGLITTDDPALGEHLRTARNYGNPGDYDTRFAGTNARLSELHATLALLSLRHLEERVAARNAVADRYRELLGQLPGIGFQQVPKGSRSSYKDFTITVDGERFGASRDAVDDALHAEGVQTRRYYSPPVHRQSAYADVAYRQLPVTDRLGDAVISMPMWSHLPLEDVERVGAAVTKIHAHAGAVEASWNEKAGA